MQAENEIKRKKVTKAVKSKNKKSWKEKMKVRDVRGVWVAVNKGRRRGMFSEPYVPGVWQTGHMPSCVCSAKPAYCANLN